MNLFKKSREIQVDKNQPFKKDLLDRENDIYNLTKLVNQIESPFTLAINGSWGSGKTTFIEMWEAYLKSQGYITIKYNAWENDSSEFPLFTFIGEIQEQIIDTKADKLKEVGKQLLESATDVISKGLESTLSSLSGGMVTLNLKDTLGDVRESLKKAPKEYVEYKKKRKEFRDSLTKFSTVATEDADKMANGCWQAL